VKAKKSKKVERQWSFEYKFSSILAVVAFLFVSMTGVVVMTRAARDDIKASFDYELRTAVETVSSGVDALYDQSQSGEISYELAYDLAVDLVDNASWNDGRRGFWAMTYEGTLLAKVDSNDFSQQVGDSVYDWQDADGLYVEREFIAAAKGGGGYVNFRMDSDGTHNSFVGYALPTKFDFLIDATYDMNYFNDNWGDYTNPAATRVIVANALGVAVVAVGFLVGRSLCKARFT
jgi:signal transduction histidine kinase